MPFSAVGDTIGHTKVAGVCGVGERTQKIPLKPLKKVCRLIYGCADSKVFRHYLVVKAA